MPGWLSSRLLRAVERLVFGVRRSEAGRNEALELIDCFFLERTFSLAKMEVLLKQPGVVWSQSCWMQQRGGQTEAQTSQATGATGRRGERSETPEGSPAGGRCHPPGSDKSCPEKHSSHLRHHRLRWERAHHRPAASLGKDRLQQLPGPPRTGTHRPWAGAGQLGEEPGCGWPLRPLLPAPGTQGSPDGDRELPRRPGATGKRSPPAAVQERDEELPARRSHSLLRSAPRQERKPYPGI